MRRSKWFALTAAVVAVISAVPMLTASATAAPAPAPAASAEIASPAEAAGIPMSQAFATKAAADAATAEVKAAYGDQLPTARAAGQCVNSWIYMTDTLGYFTHARADSTIRFYLSAGYSPCRNLTLGGRYNGCGYTGANGWILLPDTWVNGPISAGFVISACTVDP